MPNQPKKGISRRTLLVGLAGLATAGGGITLLALSGRLPSPLSSTGTPSTGIRKIASAGLKTPGLLQWGADYVSGAPYVYKDPTNPNLLVGFEVEIMQAIAGVMGITQIQIETDYGSMEQALLSNKFDFVMNGWEITSDRQKTELFSEAYYRYGQQIVVHADDSRFTQYNQNSDLQLSILDGLVVGTGTGYKAADYLATDSKINIKLYDTNLPFNDLKQKKIDAMMVDLPIVVYYVLGNGPGSAADPALKAIGKPLAPTCM
jgi:polar amino acid transport system substrate-binding protein